MAYSDNQIKSINEQAKARPGQKYVSNSGKVYVGTITKRLKETKALDAVLVKKDARVEDRLYTLEKETALKEYTETVDKKLSTLECKMIAMNIVLG